MEQLQKLKSQVFLYAVCVGTACTLALAGLVWLALQFIDDSLIIVALIIILGVGLSTLAGYLIARYSTQPIKYVWEAVMHVSPDQMGSAPDMSKARAGRELVTSLIMQIYQFASQQDGKGLAEHRQELSQAANIVNHMPLPLFVFNKEQLVTHASTRALEYCQLESSKLFGKPLFESLDLEFPSERTLEDWITDCQENRVTDIATWEHVRVQLKDDQNTVKQCDIAAYYNRDNPSGTEFIVTLFDRSGQYEQEDQSFGFLALAVHELRTPLTMLRGYIEVFEDELSDKLDPEMKDFMHKMSIAAQQLTTFISNILNIARLENEQLTLHLHEEKWEELLPRVTQDIVTRAQVNGKTVTFDIAQGLPTVAVDPVSIAEVMNNLIDNAIKYSAQSKEIKVTAKLQDNGLIETTVQDFGVGISSSVMPNLFEKFYRNHRTRSQIGGSGLGLYLCKAMITAHGGNIWASSKEGEGSTFGFTLLPYNQLAAEQKSGNNDITRSAHGWIKNHSLYRR